MTTEPSIPLGARVVMRYQLPPGSTPPLTDVIGELVSLEPPTVKVGAEQLVTVPPDQVVALKALGPRPIRTSEIRALETAAADGWPGVQQEWIDGWLLRAGHGYTNRANSAAPLGRSGAPAVLAAETLQRIAAWYAERGLPFQLLLPDRLAPVPQGWRTWSETVVLGIDIENFVLPQGPPMVRTATEPDAAWLRLHRYRGENPALTAVPQQPVPEVLTAVHDGKLGFAALGVPEPIAIGRAAVTTAPDLRRWVGLSCIAVQAAHRRHGLGALVCAELIRWGHARGATHAYVQVEADNAAALALYRDLGFLEHHNYRYAAPR
ncbi:N-acetylglutamate synthase, CG3035 family [Nocardia goodfellowii]|uniref:GNAT superfamily N-acetyltransferase n=1 Tax=Nocardia goodfellowii TaxID=882446 RepID=A0ABS4QBX8_9NOCA|nr:GNAT family N-acetyltransferase [Nocardia goodfellowii]MBP2188619.1 GNAT superfamily N-acetyltransferase [Nocardia goodfellowii]